MLIEKGLAAYKIQQILNWGIALIALFAAVLPVSAYLIFEKGNFCLDLKRFYASRKSKTVSQLDYFDLFKGGRQPFEIVLPNIEANLSLLEHIPRPDLEQQDGVILLGLNGEKRLVYQGEKVFLNCLNENEISFSTRPTPFWIEPFKGGATFYAQFFAENGELLYSREKKIHLAQRDNFEAGLPEVSKLKVYEPDLLLGMYGGSWFDGVRSSYRMCNGKDAYFVKAGDRFIWRNERWEEGEGDTKGHPLLLIRSLDSQKCEMVVWDSAGLYGKRVSVPLIKSGGALVKPHDLFCKLHQRTDTSVTCQLHNRNVILRQGDWFVYSKGIMRKLRTPEEIKEFLRYSLKGELFIFDGVNKKENGTSFVGHLFNEERTQVRKIEIPMSEKKGKK